MIRLWLSDRFRNIALALVDLARWFNHQAGFLLGITQKEMDQREEEEKQKLSITRPDNELNWVMTEHMENGKNHFGMWGVYGQPGSEEWQNEIANLPGKPIWARNITDLREEIIISHTLRYEQIQLMGKQQPIL